MLLQKVLEEEKLSYEFINADENKSLEQIDLLLELENLPPEKEMILEILNIPGMKEQLDGFNLVQFSTIFNYDIKDSADELVETLNIFIHQINITPPIGMFEINHEHNFVFYKNTLMLSDSIDKRENELLIQTIWMIFYIVNVYYKSFVNIFNGETNIDDALNNNTIINSEEL